MKKSEHKARVSENFRGTPPSHSKGAYRYCGAHRAFEGYAAAVSAIFAIMRNPYAMLRIGQALC